MKKINIKSSAISAIFVWAIRIIENLAFSIVNEMANSNIPKQWIFSIIIILLIFIGTHIYFRQGHHAKGLISSIGMLIINLILDTLITAPLF